MLTHLFVRNLATLAKVELDLEPRGLVVLTGETGAGKSLLVESLRFALGGRARGNLVREGESRAEVTAVFALPAAHPLREALAAADLDDPDEPDKLTLRRVVRGSGGGGSTLYVNGVSTPARALEPWRAWIADLTSQHAHVRLLDPAHHREVLDKLPAITPKLAAYREAYATYAARKAEYERAEALKRTRDERIESLRALLETCDELDPQPNEEPELDARWRRLANAEEIRAAAARVHALLAGESDGVISVEAVLVEALTALRPLARLDAEAASRYETRLRSLQAELTDVAADLVDYGEAIDTDGATRAELEERVEALRRLRRRFGCEPAELVERIHEARAEWHELESVDAESERLREAVEAALAEVTRAGEALRKAREKAAPAWVREVEGVLAELEMPHARLKVRQQPLAAPGPDGLDEVQLDAQTNPGEGFHPLERIASGGELSRLLLAIKSRQSGTDPVLTTVFDEVDAGIGGSTAIALGTLLRTLAADQQVLCVSHLPQIAAAAHDHLHVTKEVVDGRTFTKVERLEGSTRIDVLSKMLGGATTKKARAHAEELMREQQQSG